MKKPSPRVSSRPPFVLTCVRINVLTALEPNMESSFQGDRDVHEWSYRTAYRLKRDLELNPCIATVDEHLQTIGAESFARLER